MAQMGSGAFDEATRRQLTGSPTDENFRLDLLVVRPNRGFDIGEIKPANTAGFVAGEDDLNFYADMLTNQVMRGAKVGRLKVTIDPSSSPGAERPIDIIDDVTPVCGNIRQQLFVNRPVNGTYGYFCRPTRNTMSGDCCEGSTEPVPEIIQIGVLTLMLLLLRGLILRGGGGALPAPVPVPPTPPPPVPIPVPGFILGSLSPPVACPIDENSAEQRADISSLAPADFASITTEQGPAQGINPAALGHDTAEQEPSAGEAEAGDHVVELREQIRGLLAEVTPPVPGLGTLRSLTGQLEEGPFRTEVTTKVDELADRNASACTAGITRPTVRQGSLGPAVTEAQRKLNLGGVSPPLTEDGIFGPLTRHAVVEFQESHELEPDGIVGPNTWRELDEVETPLAF